MLRLAVPLLLLVACGYEPYTPQARGRPALGNFCSDADGEATGEVVVVTIIASVPVDVRHYDADCIVDQGHAVEASVVVESPPGGVWGVFDADTGGVLGAFTVPLDVAGTWSVTVPN